jgi:hypothetical protein
LSRPVDKVFESASNMYRGQRDDQERSYFFAHTVQAYSILKDPSDDARADRTETVDIVLKKVSRVKHSIKWSWSI